MSSLLPDNGLANLAASLLANNHEVKILDYGTVNTIKRLKIPEKEGKELYELGRKIAVDLQQKKKANEDEVAELHSLEAKLEGVQQEKTRGIAKEIVRIIGEESADFVGLKLWNGDGFTGSLMIAEELKKAYPDLPIFGGGPHVDWFKEAILQETRNIDALAYGDGEETIVLLAEYVQGKRKLEDIPNLIYKKNGDIKTTPVKWIEDLNVLPLPVYDPEVYPAMQGNQKVKILILDESRGCPYSCAFCIHPKKSGNKWRKKSKEKIVDEMAEFINKYGLNVFMLAGSTTPPNLLKEVAVEILKRGLDVEYATFGNFRVTNPDDYKLLRKSGCYAIFFGLESGSEKLLEKAMNKKTSLEKIKRALIAAKEAGIYTIASVIYPSPFETEETRKATLDLLLETRPDSVPVQFPGLIPGSQWTENPERYDFEIKNKEEYIKTLLHYKVRSLFPPILWDSLPYRCNGMNFLDMVIESSKLVQEIEQNGILTSIPQDLALIIKQLRITPQKFRDMHRTSFLTGDYKTVADMAERINKNILGDINGP